METRPSRHGNSASRDPDTILKQVESLLEAGEESKARELALKGRSMTGVSAAALRGFGLVFEDLGLARLARECYEQALRLNSKDGETLYCLAALLAETGHDEKSLHYLKKAVRASPSHQPARELLARTYQSLGLSGQAEALEPTAKRKAPSPERHFPPSVAEADTSCFLRLFSGREVGYRLQQIDPATGEMTFEYQDAPLSHETIAAISWAT